MEERQSRSNGFGRVAAVLALLLASTTASASPLFGTYVGTFGGNDSESALEGIFTLPSGAITQAAKVELPEDADAPPYTTSGLTISFTETKEEDDKTEGLAGDWSFAGPGLIDVLVIKAGNDFAVYRYDPSADSGCWDTSNLPASGDEANKGVSHISAYQIAPQHLPEPGTAVLIAVGGASLLSRRTRG